MTSNLPKLSAIATTIALSLGTITPAQSATLTYNLSGTTDSGPLVGETYSGFLSFDDANITGSGSEFLAVSAFNLNFLNPIFRNATPVSTPEVAFLNGNFLGLSFSTDTYSFIPGFFDIGEASFAYAVNQQDGAGGISYSLQTDSVSVPESTSTLVFLLFGVGIFWTKSKCKLF